MTEEKLSKKLETELEFVEEKNKLIYINLFNKVTKELLLLLPEKLTFEIINGSVTFDDSLVYKLLINNKIVFFDVYLDSQVIYSLYNSIDKTFIKSYTNSIEVCLKQIKEDLNG